MISSLFVIWRYVLNEEIMYFCNSQLFYRLKYKNRTQKVYFSGNGKKTHYSCVFLWIPEAEIHFFCKEVQGTPEQSESLNVLNT